jgi:DNA-directed RNA polymerase subunit RPC12/RpoP
MNLVEKIIYCYEYIFYKEYTCFNCGVNFRMKKMDDEDTSPACSYSCLMTGGVERSERIQEFKNKHGKNWKIEYTKYIKDPENYLKS